jgi:hypothetical protein
MTFRTDLMAKGALALASSLLALFLWSGISPIAHAQGAMLKCRNAHGQIEYKNSGSQDPSCVVVNKNDTRGDSGTMIKIGMSKYQIRTLLGQPNKIAFRVMPEGRIEAWVYGNGISLGFRNDVLVLIEGER